jgi:uncharacterized protein
VASTNDNDSGLSGPEVVRVFRDATEWLHVNVESINAINVFPVPDGDTGTNMYLTMRSAMDSVPESVPDSSGEVLGVMAHGALLGARGNSGVILSQYIRGFAAAIAGTEQIDGQLFASALRAGAEAANAAVDSPVAGTILTVGNEVAKSLTELANDSLLEVMETATEAAAVAVASTPTLLPVLRDAGVVDSGAQGLFVLLDGILRSLRGESIPEIGISAGNIDQTWLADVAAAHQDGERFSYCTEFLLHRPGLSVESLRDRMHEFGDSVLVVGDSHALHVHLHTADPGGPLTYCVGFGDLDKIKIENMQLQYDALAAPGESADAGVTRTLSVVAMCAGSGQADVLRSIGATKVLETGGRNPSTAEILDAVAAANSNSVIVLPNDKNIALAADQAAKISVRPVWVAPTVSFPQVVASVLSYDPERGFGENQEAIGKAIGAVHTIEITTAIRDATVDGVNVKCGMTMAIVDGVLTIAHNSVKDCIRAALSGVCCEDTSLVTAYWGNNMLEHKNEWIVQIVKDISPMAEVEIVFGGQPIYDYVIAVE